MPTWAWRSAYLMLSVAYVLFLLLTPLFNWLQAHFGAALQIEPPQFRNMPERPEQLQPPRGLRFRLL